MATGRSAQRTRARLSRRGFTLIELMIVVAIVGVLAGLGVYGVRKYMFASRTAEAGEMIGAIKAQQEAYRGDSFGYLDVSGVHALTDLTTFYPSTNPGNYKTVWGDTSTEVGKRWQSLNVHSDGGMYFSYGCAAGEAADAVDNYEVAGIWAGTPRKAIDNWPKTSAGPWYVIKVVGDLNGDGKKQLWIAASFTDQVFNNIDTE